MAHWVRWLLVSLGGIALIILSFLLQVFKGLPDPAQLKNYEHYFSTEVYSAEGKKIGEFTAERRYPVKFEEIPDEVKQAFIAAEDAKFYEHKGIDFVGIARAALQNVISGRFAQGASTITQQVARSLLLTTRKKEITRKIREMILAREIENSLTKDEILALYLREIYLGHGAYGLGAAARNYFHKSVDQLNLSEAALLAGLPQRPAAWDPFKSPQAAKRRQRYVLEQMVDEKYISSVQAEDAYRQPLTLYPLKSINSVEAPYFVEYVRLYLNEKFGEENVLKSGYRVHTTVKHALQKQAEKALDTGLREVDKRVGWRGPVGHLDSSEVIQKFLADKHEDILSTETPARILSSDVDSENNKLQNDLVFFEDKQNLYFGPTPVKEGFFYQGVVSEFGLVKDLESGAMVEQALVRIGQTPTILTMKGTEWVKVSEKIPSKISEFLKAGDIIHVKVEEINRKANSVRVSLEQEPDIQGALLSYEVKTGHVEAMVGGTDFLKSQFNRALSAKRQVGSTFKPLIYAAAIDKGFSPSSLVTDAPVVFDYQATEESVLDTPADWRPKNYGEKFVGEVPLRLALTKSMNVPTIKILNEIGVSYAIDYARSLGIHSEFPKDLTVALGSWSSSLEEMMRAYSIFPRLGHPINLVYITKIEDAHGNVIESAADRRPASFLPGSGKDISLDAGKDTLYEGEPVISAQTAYVMTDMLRAVVTEGTGRKAAEVGGSVAGKTGTSNDFHDAWFIGYSPSVMTGVWVGFDRDRAIGPGEAGGKAAAPIWVDYMKHVVQANPREQFPIPEDVVFAYIDRQTGRLASIQNPNRVRVAFRSGTVPTARGDNVLRVREPGVREVTEGQITPGPESPIPGIESPSIDSEKEEDISDVLRESYE